MAWIMREGGRREGGGSYANRKLILCFAYFWASILLMIQRDISHELLQSASEYPVVTVLGPRQSGKTTLVRMTFPDKPYFSLEDPDIRMAAEADPRSFLAQAEDGGILDEVQRLPLLLSYIQGSVDNPHKPGRFILTGSHQPQLHAAISQSLAGRTAVLNLWPFSIQEIQHYGSATDPFDLIYRGFFPRLHEDKLQVRRFFNGYVQTYVERDVRALIQLRDLSLFQKFLTLLAGRIGQVVNLASLGNDVGASAQTIRNWLSVLKASFILFELPPFSENIQKRLIKSPKIYFTDVGLAAFLLGIRTPEQAFRDPLRGNLYENLVIADIVKSALNRGIRPDACFFRDSNGNEIDLLLRENGLITPIEIKSAATFSRSFIKKLEWLQHLGLKGLRSGVVLFNGNQPLTVRGIRVFNPLHVEDIWQSLTIPKPSTDDATE